MDRGPVLVYGVRPMDRGPVLVYGVKTRYFAKECGDTCTSSSQVASLTLLTSLLNPKR